jgi:glycerol-3-phosphate dehydrogenase
MHKSNPLLETDLYYDTVIIGGGIVGAGIFRDLSINGVKTLLVDKKDFSSQTSSKSSKMLHGGIRYLENMDFDLVFEALHEKNLWLKLAPHLCYESSFYMPVFKDSLRPKWMIKIGLFLYDLLSSFKNTSHRMASKSDTIKALPHIKPDGLKGAGVYYDAVVDDARLTIEVILDALNEPNSRALNHVGLESFTFDGQRVEVKLKDELTGEKKTIHCKEIVMATGPFTDDILANHPQLSWERKLLASKGSHLWLKKGAIDINSPLVMTPNDGRVIFVIPQKDHILVGTTEEKHNGDKFDLKASENEINYLINNLNEYFPAAQVTRDEIVSSFAGIRPLVSEGGSDRGKTARNHKYFQPRSNLHVIMGGKYTTFRVMAKDVAQNICSRLGFSYNSTKSKRPLRVTPTFKPFEDTNLTPEVIEKIRSTELVRTQEDLKRRTSLSD